jgi:hypothetical protein
LPSFSYNINQLYPQDRVENVPIFTSPMRKPSIQYGDNVHVAIAAVRQSLDLLDATIQNRSSDEFIPTNITARKPRRSSFHYAAKNIANISMYNPTAQHVLPIAQQEKQQAVANINAQSVVNKFYGSNLHDSNESFYDDDVLANENLFNEINELNSFYVQKSTATKDSTAKNNDTALHNEVSKNYSYNQLYRTNINSEFDFNAIDKANLTSIANKHDNKNVNAIPSFNRSTFDAYAFEQNVIQNQNQANDILFHQRNKNNSSVASQQSKFNTANNNTVKRKSRMSFAALQSIHNNSQFSMAPKAHGAHRSSVGFASTANSRGSNAPFENRVRDMSELDVSSLNDKFKSKKNGR